MDDKISKYRDKHTSHNWELCGLKKGANMNRIATCWVCDDHSQQTVENTILLAHNG